MAQEVYHQAFDPNVQNDPAKASEKGIEASAKLKKIQEELGKLQTTPATAKTVADAQEKVKTYSTELLNTLLGVSRKHA